MRHGEEVDDNFFGVKSVVQWWLDDCWMLSWTVEHQPWAAKRHAGDDLSLFLPLLTWEFAPNVIVGCYNMRSWNLTWNLKMVISKFGIWSSRGPPIFRFHLNFRGCRTMKDLLWMVVSFIQFQACWSSFGSSIATSNSRYKSMASWPNLDLFNCHMGCFQK